jgi:hypothetical protein
MIFNFSKIVVSNLLFLLFLSPVFSQGDLMVMPKRVVFDGSKRSEVIHLFNTGKDSASYRLSFVQYKMTETGSFEQIEVPEKGQQFASDFLRYYPRVVTLGPQEAQTIKIQLTKTNLLQEGEYRSHMYFRAEEKPKALGEDDETKAVDEISISIKTIFGISIPVIIRKGEDNSLVNFSDLILNLKKDEPQLTMALNRVGNMSVYGNLNIFYVAPNGNTKEIAMVKGLAVYTPNKLRIFTMPLKNLENLSLNIGQFKIEYKEESGRLLGETLINLN